MLVPFHSTAHVACLIKTGLSPLSIHGSEVRSLNYRSDLNQTNVKSNHRICTLLHLILAISLKDLLLPNCIFWGGIIDDDSGSYIYIFYLFIYFV